MSKVRPPAHQPLMVLKELSQPGGLLRFRARCSCGWRSDQLSRLRYVDEAFVEHRARATRLTVVS